MKYPKDADIYCMYEWSYPAAISKKIKLKQKFCQEKVEEPKLFTPAGCCLSIRLGLPCVLRLAWWSLQSVGQAWIDPVTRRLSAEPSGDLGEWEWTLARKLNHMTKSCERDSFKTTGCTHIWGLFCKLKPNHMRCTARFIGKSYLWVISSIRCCFDTKR